MAKEIKKLEKRHATKEEGKEKKGERHEETKPVARKKGKGMKKKDCK